MGSELAITFEETNLGVGEDFVNFNFEIDASFSIEPSDELTVPTSLFKQDSGLRGIVRYLHDEKKLSFNEIASSLKRHINTIRTSYEKSKPQKFSSGVELPVRIFKEKSPLGEAALFLAKKGYRLKEISTLLDRDSKTIWTVLNRKGWKQ